MRLTNCILFIFLFVMSFGFKSPEKDTTRSKEEVVNQIIRRIQLPQIGQSAVNINDFGAVGDGVADCKPAIDAAIAKASSLGGGKVIFPAGTFFCKGPIHLENKINLHLEKGCTVLFSQDDKDYLPLQLVRWEGVEIYNYSPYIYAINKKDIAITGEGKFDGNAEGGIRNWRSKQKPAQNKARQMGHELVPVKERVFGEGHYLRFSFIQFLHCENILISDVTIENVPFWVMHPTYCKNITIKNVNVNCPSINNDGIDFDSCEDALVEDCVFNCGDDAIVIKSGRDDDAWRVNKPSRNIVIRNCLALEVLHGLAFGSEMSGGVENIYIDNFYMKKVKQYAIQFKANRDRGGYIQNVFIDGVFIDTTTTAIYFTNDYHSYSGGNSPSEFHHIEIKNVFCTQANGSAIDIKGLAEKPIHNVRLENITVLKEEKPSTATNTENCKTRNVNVKGKEFLIED
ncbi:MAG: glycoside hydrolase family 28 protein [Bacteroidetes bacterium]|nr:glycoside hydrolase family 28 protein [Bacteroidota bacterium]